MNRIARRTLFSAASGAAAACIGTRYLGWPKPARAATMDSPAYLVPFTAAKFETNPAPNGYLTEPHGCPSPDGRRVVFASSWRNSTGPIAGYVAEFR